MEQSAWNTQGGNTIRPSHATKSRCYMITNFNMDEPRDDPKAIYSISCLDTSKEGRIHCHIVLYYKNPISWKTVKKLLPSAHIEMAHNAEDSIGYITQNKNGRKYDVIERGDRPIKHKFATMAELKDMDEDDVPPYLYSAFSKYKNKPQKVKIGEWRKDVKVYYIQGPSGIGKSTKAEELVTQNGFDEIEEVKHVGQFWTGCVDGTGCAIYDDFRSSHMTASEFINFIDYRTHNLNIKGGSVKNNYSLIIITSVEPLSEIYSNISGEPREQWMRRIELIDMDTFDLAAAV